MIKSDTQTAPTATGPSRPEEPGPKLFRVGTLAYTRAGLFMLFAWMAWADVCFTIMEALPGGAISIKLKALDTPNWLMAVMMSTIPMFLNATICPWVSFASDRHRGPLGRRMPFILYTAPFMTISMIGIGFSHPIGQFLGGLLKTAHATLAPTTVELIVVGFFSTMFAFFNMFVASVFWYLFRDVVPEEVMSRFLSLMRIVGTGAGAFYNFFILQYALDLTYIPWVLLGGGVLYLVGFGLVCLNVREGQYPPPVKFEDGPGMISGVKTYARECYTHKFYWLYYLYGGISCIGGAIGMFGLFFQLQMGLTKANIGTLGGIGGVWSLVLLYFAGSLADRFHPIRTQLTALLLTAIFFTPQGLLWLFYNPTPSTFFYISLISGILYVPIGVLQAVSGTPMEMRIFPKQLYGQFCSANALIRSVLVMVAGPLAGGFIDIMKKMCHGSDYAYRYMAIWQVTFGWLAVAFFLLMYREWKRLGGSESFVPPEVEPRPGGELAN